MSPESQMWRVALVLVCLCLLCSLGSEVMAEPARPGVGREAFGHGPSSSKFPSHSFQLQGRAYRPQLNVHIGLLQPILTRGFNVAMDFRVWRFIFEYSHGMFLQYHPLGLMAQSDIDVGMELHSPWTTGFGIGFNIIDDLFLMVEFKAHRYDAILDGETKSYTTISIGPTIGWRFFIWRGLNITAYLRYWPNIWSSVPEVGLSGGRHRHLARNLNFFANLSLGWAFDLTAHRK